MERQTVWTQRSVAGLTGLAITASLILMPMGISAQATTNPPNPAKEAPAQSIVDPYWRSIIEQVDRNNALRQPDQAQAFAPTIHVNLATHMITGRVDRPDPLTFRLTRGNDVIASFSTQPSFEGASYSYVATPVQTYYNYFYAGDVIEVIQAGQSVSLTVPGLNAFANPTTNIVAGLAPSTTVVHLQVTPYAQPDLKISQVTTPTLDNEFSADLSSLIDIKPRDHGFAWVDLTSRQHVYAAFTAPFLRIEAGGQVVAGEVSPNSSAYIRVTDSNGITRTSTSAGGYGTQFFASLGLILNTGDHVIADFSGATITTTIPKLTLLPTNNNTAVTGEAPANTTVELRRYTGPITDQVSSILEIIQPSMRVTTTVNAQGVYSVPLALTAGDYVFVAFTNTEGNEIFARYITPFVRARLGSPDNYYYNYNPNSGYQVLGQFNSTVPQPVTITVQGPSGYLKGQRSTTSYDSGYFLDALNYGYPSDGLLALDTGDVITVASGSGTTSTLSVPAFTVEADLSEYAVYGTAPPNAVVKLVVPLYYSAPYPAPPTAPVATSTPFLDRSSTHEATAPTGGGPYPPNPPYLWTVVVTATASGYYSITLPELARYYGQLIGEAELRLSNGNVVARSFSGIASCKPYASYVTIGGNTIALANANCQNKNFEAQVFSAAGTLKWSSANLTYGYISMFEGQSTKPVLIAAGDQIKIIQGAYTSSSTVPTLTVQANKAANSIGGIAPPNITVTIRVVDAPIPYLPYGAYGSLYTETRTNAQGVYSLAVGSAITLGSGSLVQANIVTKNLSTTAIDVIPVLNVQLTEQFISGVLPPYTPYSLEVISPTNPITPANGNTPAYVFENGYFFGNYTRPIRPGDQVVLKSPSTNVSVTVPALGGQIDPNTGVLTGRGPVGGRIVVYQWSPMYQYYTNLVTQLAELNISPAGLFSLTLPAAVLASRPDLNLVVRYDHDQTVRIWKVINLSPVRWMINLKDRSVSGILPSDITTATLTLRTANNQLKDKPIGNLLFGGNSFGAVFSRSIDIGDILELKYADQTFTYTVPVFTAEYRGKSGAIVGRAPINTRLQVTVSNLLGFPNQQQVQRRTQSSSSGTYGIDINDIRPLLNSNIQIVLTDLNNNSVQLDLIAVAANISMPIVMRR